MTKGKALTLDLDLSNINEGDVIPNYKQLCKILGIEEKKADSKDAQMKEINRFIGYEKDGYAFVIKEIYQNELEQIDKRKIGNNSIYLSHFEIVILDYLYDVSMNKKNFYKYANNNVGVVEMTNRQIFTVTGMVNSFYMQKEFNELIPLWYPEITKEMVDVFYSKIRDRLNKTLNRMLTNLENRFYITRKKHYKILVDGNWETTDDIEDTLINDLEADVLKSLGCKEMSHVYYRNIQGAFYKSLNEMVIKKYKDEYGWEKVYKINCISFTKRIRGRIESFKKEFTEVWEQKKLLNSKLTSSMNESIEKYYYKIHPISNSENIIDCDKIEDDMGGWGEPSSIGKSDEDKATDFSLPENYIQNQKKLVELLISLGDLNLK